MALLVFGKQSATFPPGDDGTKVPPTAEVQEEDLMKITDGLPLVVPRFASPSQAVCVPTLLYNLGAAVAAQDMGCTIISAGEDQPVIGGIVRELSDLARDSSHNDPEIE